MSGQAYYPIFDHFSEAAREAAADAEYVGSPPRAFRGDLGSCCPLGICLAVDGLGRHSAPGGWAVASCVIGDDRNINYYAVRDLTCAFINDFDDGKVEDLRAAMGLPAKGGA